jgi:hypothetical protein
MKLNQMKFKDRLDVIQTEVKMQKATRLRKDLDGCLKVLNNRTRYIYYWQADTEAHKSFIRFLCLIKRIQKESGQTTQDILYDFLDNINPKLYITLWLIFKLYNNKRDQFGFKLNHDKNELLDELTANTGSITEELEANYEEARRAFKIAKKFEKPFLAEDIKSLR